ncbi:MAG: Bax inhibitor-1/YccA family protein [Bacteroidota bacterium]|nr:Bax inhibitor-1/YccA family protein [Bacteroidota bacterium]
MLKKFSGGGNPFLQKAMTSTSSSDTYGRVQEGVMTVQGAINKTLLLFLILLVTATFNYQAQNVTLMIAGGIVGLVLVLITVFKKEYSPIIAPIYAGVEGLLVGGISGIYAGFGGGIVIQAVSLTLLVLFVMLFIHKTGIIPVTQKFRMGVVMATGAVALMYLATLVLGIFGIQIPYIHEGGTLGIIFSLVIIGIASLNLLLDFDSIVKGAQYGAPKYMEWFSAMGLMITLIWLYLEILRLLAKMKD